MINKSIETAGNIDQIKFFNGEEEIYSMKETSFLHKQFMNSVYQVALDGNEEMNASIILAKFGGDGATAFSGTGRDLVKLLMAGMDELAQKFIESNLVVESVALMCACKLLAKILKEKDEEDDNIDSRD